MQTLIFLVAILVNSHSPLVCTAKYELPGAIEKHLSKRHGVIEVITQEPTGYILEFFFDRVYFRGWFYREGKTMIVCDIEFVIEVDAEGNLLFIWDESQKEM